MKRLNLDAAQVSLLALWAGFDFTIERCALLVPQLNWVLDEARKIERLERAGLEPANTFSPCLWRLPEPAGEKA
jgi:hypothetical protein